MEYDESGCDNGLLKIPVRARVPNGLVRSLAARLNVTAPTHVCVLGLGRTRAIIGCMEARTAGACRRAGVGDVGTRLCQMAVFLAVIALPGVWTNLRKRQSARRWRGCEQ